MAMDSSQEKEILPLESNFLIRYLHLGLTVYVELINYIIIGILDTIYAIWKILTSEEAIKFYIILAKVIFFVFVIAVTILGAIAEAENKKRRRR